MYVSHASGPQTPAIPIVPPNKPSPRNLAWQRNVKIIVGVSCAAIILCGGLYFSGKLPDVGNYIMFAGMGAGSLSLLGCAIGMPKLRNIDAKYTKKGEETGNTALIAAIRKGQTTWVRIYLYFGANPSTPGRDRSPLQVANDRLEHQIKQMLLSYGASAEDARSPSTS